MTQPSTLTSSDYTTEASAGTFNFPASFAQRRLWFLDQLAPDDASYNIAGAVQIEGALEAEALEKGVQEIVRRHESLRTRFESNGGEPQQVIDPDATLFLQRVDLRSIAEEERWLKADQLMREESQKPFDLRRGPLLRAKLIQLADREHRLLVTMHHIISDGWSVGILVAELAELYTAFREGRPSTLPELPIQYADYSAWQQEQLSGESLKSLVDYWKRQLESPPCGLDMITDRPYRQNRSTRGAQHDLRIEPGVVRRLQQLGQQHGATLYMILLAAFQTLLFRYSGQTDILVGSPIAGRIRKETQGLIGCFVNTLVLRSRFTSGLTFRELLRSVKDTTLEAYAHQDLPFEKMVEDLSPQRNLGRSPFFQAMFVLQNAPMPELQLSSAILRLIDIQSETAKFELTLTLVESESGLTGNIEYSSDLFDPPTVARLAEHLSFLLKELVSEPDRPVSLVPLVSTQEMTRLRLGWAGPASTNVKGNVLSLLQSHATDEAKIAIICKGRTFTYADLDRCAEKLATRLDARGFKPGMSVGLCFKDGVKGVIALLAVLKAGAVGVPLDVDLPVSRLEYILRDAGAQWAVSDRECSERIQQAGIQVFSVHDDEEPSTLTHALNKREIVRQHGNMLVLYQSDPSGKPRGVVVWDSDLLLRPFANTDAVLPTDRVAQRVTLSSRENELVELLRAFAAGATIVDAAEEKTPRRLATVLREQGVTVLVTRGAELARLAAEFGWALDTVRIILLNEHSEITLERLQRSLNPTVLERTYQACGSNDTGGWWGLRSMGAITNRLTDNLAAGVTLQLLDNHNNPVPEHIAGEIFIGRGEMQSGHRGSAVSDHFGHKSNVGLYRSGEFAWRHPDGSLNLCGRRDGRGWVSGLRVEPQEIEIVLKADANLQDAGVLVGEDTVRAFIVAGDRAAVDAMAIKQRLEDNLPTLMVPQRLDLTEAIPKLPDGSVDRAALQALANSVDSSTNIAPEYVAPRNDIEKTLVTIWEKTLGLDRVGIHDDFFHIGGHSLLATQVIARISEELGASIPLRQLFETPTIARFGEIVASTSQLGETFAPIPRVARVPVGAESLSK